MDEYGLVLEPKYPDEAFEALSDTMADKVFTHEEGVECISDVLNIGRASAGLRFEKLIRDGNVRELV